MFEVLKNIANRRTETEKGISLTFKATDQKRFATFQEAKKYADVLSKNLKRGQFVYISENNRCTKYYTTNLKK